MLLLFIPVLSGAENEGSVTLTLSRSKLYSGESAVATVALISKDDRIKNIQLPQLKTTAGISAGEFSLSAQRELAEGTQYLFDADITAREPGSYVIGPASVAGNSMSQSGGVGGFFGETGARSVSLSSEPVSINVLSLPVSDRPPGFDGAMGVFSLAVSTTPTKLSEGEPLTVTTVISGHGNFSKIGCPTVNLDGIRGYPPVATRAVNRLTCQQLIITGPALGKGVPPVQFSFFNTSTASYQTLRSSLIPISFSDTQREQPSAAVASLAPPSVEQGEGGWLTAGCLLVAAVVAGGGAVLFFRSRSVRVSGEVELPPASLSKPDVAALVSAAEAAADDCESDRFYLSVQKAALTLQRITPSNAVLEELISHCNAVRYGLQHSSPERAQHMLETLKKLTGHA